MAFKGVVRNLTDKGNNTVDNILNFLNQHDVHLEEGEDVLLPFWVRYTQTEEEIKEKKQTVIIQHKTLIYQYSSLKTFEAKVKDSMKLLNEVSQLFEDNSKYSDLKVGVAYDIPCILTELNGSLTLRCVPLS